MKKIYNIILAIVIMTVCQAVTNENPTQKGFKIMPDGSVKMLGTISPDMSKCVRIMRNDLGKLQPDYFNPDVIRGRAFSLDSLMMYADLIVVGKVKRILRARGNYDYLINGELIKYIDIIEIEKIVASVWDRAETQNRLTLNNNDLTNLLYVVIHSSIKANPPIINDAVLERNGRYLLWLNYYPLEGADAKKYDLCGKAMYKTTIGIRGALLLSESKLAPLLTAKTRKFLKTSKKNSFNTTDCPKIVNAVSSLAKGMAKSAQENNAVEEFKNARDDLSLSTNSLSRLKGIKRFEIVDMNLQK
jgi:hypothetical protein